MSKTGKESDCKKKYIKLGAKYKFLNRLDNFF